MAAMDWGKPRTCADGGIGGPKGLLESADLLLMGITWDHVGRTDDCLPDMLWNARILSVSNSFPCDFGIPASAVVMENMDWAGPYSFSRHSALTIQVLAVRISVAKQA